MQQNPLLANSPLVLALCQARFTPVLAIGDYIKEIQERIRDNYPFYEETSGHELRIRSTDDQVTTIKRMSRWLFASADKRTCVVVTPDFVTLQSSNYAGFERFRHDFVSVAEAVSEIARIRLSERIGLRYVNRIVPAADKGLRDYLADGLRGMHAEDLSEDRLVFRPTLNQVEILSKTESGSSLVLRCLEKPANDTSFPPGINLDDVDSSLAPINRHTALLDIDQFATGTVPFDSATLAEVISSLHEHTHLVFRKSCKPDAIAEWDVKQ